MNINAWLLNKVNWQRDYLQLVTVNVKFVRMGMSFGLVMLAHSCVYVVLLLLVRLANHQRLVRLNHRRVDQAKDHRMR